MTSPAFDALLEQARAAHRDTADIARFCPFPTDLRSSSFTAFHIKSADLMAADPVMNAPDAHPLARAFIAAGPQAQWRETYKNTMIGDDFMDRFACYCLIGQGGPWISDQMAGFVVYMPPGLHYTWHHHPAEELYYVLAGQAEFLREGADSKVLHTGDSSFHASNQPHAMETHDHPVMAYVIWRNHLGTPPVLTERTVDRP